MEEKKFVEVIALTPERYKVLEKSVGRIGVDHQTTPLEAAFQLGVQHVLKALRDGYVAGTPRGP